MNKQMLSAHQAARVAGVTRQTILDKIKHRTLPSIKDERGNHRIPADDVRRYAEHIRRRRSR